MKIQNINNYQYNHKKINFEAKGIQGAPACSSFSRLKQAVKKNNPGFVFYRDSKLLQNIPGSNELMERLNLCELGLFADEIKKIRSLKGKNYIKRLDVLENIAHTADVMTFSDAFRIEKGLESGEWWASETFLAKQISK